MTIQLIGPWVLLALGGVVLICAAVAHIKHPSPQGPWIWIFGVAIAGIGVYGPTFLEPYGKFIQPLLDMQASPSEETYKAAFGDIADGALPPEYQELALTYALDRPIPKMDKLLAQAAGSAKDKDGKEALLAASRDLEGREAAADVILNTLSPEDSARIREFDSTTLQFLHRKAPERIHTPWRKGDTRPRRIGKVERSRDP